MAELQLPFSLKKPGSDEYVTQTSEIGHNGQPLDDMLDNIDSDINGGTTAITGTFVQNGIISLDGSFISNSGFTIKSYSVSSGEVLHIQTEIKTEDYVNRAQVAAYDNDTFVEVVSTGEVVTDISYTVPTGVNKICVYNNNTKDQSVILTTGSGLKDDVSNLKTRMPAVENGLEDINEYIETITPTLTPLSGTFVQNGVIATDGSIVSNAGFSIYRYEVSEGDNLRIHTELDSDSTLNNRAQVTAYNNGVFVAVVSSGNIITDTTYTVPSGVTDIYLYVRNGKNYSVKLFEGIDLPTDIPQLKEQTKSLDEDVSGIQDTLDSLQSAEEYDNTDFYEDDEQWKSYFYYMPYSVGQTAPTEPSKSPTANLWGCLKIHIRKGQKISVKTNGGSNGRAYCVTDDNRKIIVIAPANTNTVNNPFTYQFLSDGYLYVNCNPNTLADFSVKVWTELSDIISEITELDNRVDTIEEEINISSVPKINNPAYNLQKTSLKILHIGNSFMDDQTALLSGLCQAAGVNTSDMCLYNTLRSGGTFKNWYDVYHGTDEQNPTVYKKIGGITQTIISDGTIGSAFRSALKDNTWDIIIIQQASDYSGEYEVWEGHDAGGYLQEFLRILRTWQPHATIAFDMVHASPSQSGGSTSEKTQARWQEIAKSCKWMMSNYGIDLIIPCGAAIENIRASVLNTSNNGLTRDNHHLGYGLARYVAASCYFQTIIAPRFGISVLGNTYRYEVTDAEKETAGTYVSGCIDVTNNNAEAAQMAAILACNNMYSVNNPDNIEL